MIIFIKSFLIGICAILPGVSGSVIAVSFGIYDKFIDIVSNKNKLKNNLLFIFIVSLGVSLGIVFGSNMLLYIFKYKTILYYSLIGIILSEVPFLIKKIHIKTNKGLMITPCLLAFVFSLLLDLLNKESVNNTYSVFKYFLGGILFSFGKVFPGISSSFFLLCLGIFDRVIVLVTNPFLLFKNMYFYFPFIIGTLFGFILFIRLLSYLMSNHYRLTYSVITGFVLSSLIILFPKFSFDISHIIGIILMNVFFIVFLIVKNRNNE